MRKLLSVLSSTLQGGVRGGLLLLLLVASVSAIYASDIKVGGIWYDFDSSTKTASVTYQGNSYDAYDDEYSGIVDIPETVTYKGTTYGVKSIGDYAFYDCSSLTSVTIGESVTSIGESAFRKCSSLTSVTIGESVTSIGEYAFSDCSSLTSVTIPNSVTSIGESAFRKCSSLTFVTIPNSVTSIGSYAFEGCSSLRSVTIGESVTNISPRAFRDCSKLTSVTIPESVTSIGSSAFYNCQSLTSIKLPNSVTSIGDYAFYGCSFTSPLYNAHCFAYMPNLSGAYTIPEGIKQIVGAAFYDCHFLTSVTIPNSVTSIGCGAFYECSSLTSVTIGESVTSIGEDAFRDCSKLTSVTIPESVTSIGNGAFYNTGIYNNKSNWESKVLYIDNCLIGAEGSISGAYTIKENTRLIANYAFANCTSLTSITIPNSVTSIGCGAFYECSSLTSVTIGESVTSIGEDAFYYCSLLTSITIPNSVTSIGGHAFSYCFSLTSIFIPNSVKSIGDWAFTGCTFTKDNFVNNSTLDAVANNYWGAEFVDAEIEGLLIRNDTVIDCRNFVTSITIPNGVTSIGDGAFADCSFLTSITIPESVTSIGKNAFSAWFSSSSLTSITIPNSVTSIGEYAFYGCFSLATVTLTANSVEEFCKSQGNGLLFNAGVTCRRYIQIDGKDIIEITIPNGVTSIGDHAFYGCTSLTSITIPNSVTSIGNGAFLACSLTSVTIPKSVTSIGELAFYGCSALDSVVWNAKNYTNFSKKENAPFYDSRSQIKSFTFGESVEHIPAYLCTGMNMLTSITIPNSVTYIGNETFRDCSSLSSITIPNSVTSIGKGTFEGCAQLEKLTLGSAVKNVAANAFAGCNRLYHIYCYPTNPPVADQSSFSNYNVYLYVPCDYKEEYDLDIFWGNFKYIECIESEDVSTNGVVITPSTNDVTITWPAEAGADTYTIVIKKGNEVFCTLTFNADGQLLNIAYAPGRDSNNHGAQYAEQAGNGYRFTVTGLEEGAHYTYNIDVRDAANKTIKSYSGEFTAESMTAVENITTNNANIQKILRDGQLLILRDGVEYTVMGAEVK